MTSKSELFAQWDETLEDYTSHLIDALRRDPEVDDLSATLCTCVKHLVDEALLHTKGKPTVSDYLVLNRTLEMLSRTLAFEKGGFSKSEILDLLPAQWPKDKTATAKDPRS